MTVAAWVLYVILGVLLEGLALGDGGTTLSASVRMLRFDPVGRVALLMLWTWLTWHWTLRPRATLAFTWRDGVALATGLAWALVEMRRGT